MSQNTNYICFILILLFSCKSSPDFISDEEIVERFYDGYNNSDFEQIKKYSSDSIQIIWGESVVCRSQNELYKGFQFDSVLKSKIRIFEIKPKNNALEVALSKYDKRIQFLHDTAFVYKAMINIKDNQIAKIEINNFILLDLNKIKSRKDSLVVWIDKNHPELKGFAKDQTLIRAQDYLKAIDLYNDK